jgi:hypothetical protein
MKLREGDVLYGTVGVLGLCGVIFVVRTMDQILSPLIGYQLAMLLSGPVIAWGGLTSFIVTYRALKGGHGEF